MQEKHLPNCGADLLAITLWSLIKFLAVITKIHEGVMNGTFAETRDKFLHSIT